MLFGLVFLFGSVMGQGFRQVALDLHNEYRALYGLNPLLMDSQLNVMAHRHAEELALLKQLRPSNNGYPENLWEHRGILRSLSIDTRDAVNSWYTGSTVPGNTTVSINPHVLRSNGTKTLGIGVATSNDYTVVVANYFAFS